MSLVKRKVFEDNYGNITKKSWYKLPNKFHIAMRISFFAKNGGGYEKTFRNDGYVRLTIFDKQDRLLSTLIIGVLQSQNTK